jgi:hypothetical protein
MKAKILLVNLLAFFFLGCSETINEQDKVTEQKELLFAAMPASIEQDSLFIRLNYLLNQNLESHRHVDLGFLNSEVFTDCLKNKYETVGNSFNVYENGFSNFKGFLEDCGVNDIDAVNWMISGLDMMKTYKSLLERYPELEHLHGDSILTELGKQMHFPIPNPQNF